MTEAFISNFYYNMKPCVALMGIFSMLPLAFATEPEDLTISLESIVKGVVCVPAGYAASIDVQEGESLTVSQIRLVDPIFNDGTSVALTINLAKQESDGDLSFGDILGGLGGNWGGGGLEITPPDGESMLEDTCNLIFSSDFKLTVELTDSFLSKGAQSSVEFSLVTFNSSTFGTHWSKSGLSGELFDYITFVTERDEVLDVVVVDKIDEILVNETRTFKVRADVPQVNIVPEPTTATLSLLALAGLAARRRRK